ncbi:MAG: hypothetical protein Q4A82_07155 [Corynebacterium sp.]|nr:hypothetical protein [Corynebacterium sp.]
MAATHRHQPAASYPATKTTPKDNSTSNHPRNTTPTNLRNHPAQTPRKTTPPFSTSCLLNQGANPH